MNGKGVNNDKLSATFCCKVGKKNISTFIDFPMLWSRFCRAVARPDTALALKKIKLYS